MAFKSGAKGQNRDFGLHGAGAGKGSAPRNNASAEFRANHDATSWPVNRDLMLGIDPRVKRVGNKLVKTYR